MSMMFYQDALVVEGGDKIEDIISEIEKLLDYKSSSSDGDITFVETDIAKIQEQLINLYTTITDRP